MTASTMNTLPSHRQADEKSTQVEIFAVVFSPADPDLSGYDWFTDASRADEAFDEMATDPHFHSDDLRLVKIHVIAESDEQIEHAMAGVNLVELPALRIRLASRQ